MAKNLVLLAHEYSKTGPKSPLGGDLEGLVSGFYYYSDRYYNPNGAPMFISPDRLWDVRPWQSPYAYCSNSPINRVDPTGMLDGWVEGEDGNYTWHDNIKNQKDFDKSGLKGTFRGDQTIGINKEGLSVNCNSDGTMTRRIYETAEFSITDKKSDINKMVDYGTLLKVTIYPVESILELGMAASDFIKNYNNMIEANVRNSDKYFHSKANYEASSRGVVGRFFATHFSNLREIFDQRVKGDSRSDSWADQEANYYGRSQVGITPNGQKASAKYRPNGLPSKY